MGVFMLIVFFLIYAAFSGVLFLLLYYYGSFIASLENELFYANIVFLCIVAAVLLLLLWLAARAYVPFATRQSKMFRHVDKYGLESASSAGVFEFGVLSLAGFLLVWAFGMQRETAVLYPAELVLALVWFLGSALWYYRVWSRCQTYYWCPKCGRYWGKTYRVADEIGRETHEYKFKERERASTVENAGGQVVASVYNDVEKTGYTVSYYYRLRHHCKHCGDWEEKIHIEKPKGFDGSWTEQLYGETLTEHINVDLAQSQSAEPAPAPQVTAAPPQQQIVTPQKAPNTMLGYDTLPRQVLNGVALEQLEPNEERKQLPPSDDSEA